MRIEESSSSPGASTIAASWNSGGQMPLRSQWCRNKSVHWTR